MKRFPLLLIALALFGLAGFLIYFGTTYSTASPQQQEYIAKTVTKSGIELFPAAILAFVLLGFLIWIWALVHMLTNQALKGSDKIVWVIVIVFLNVLGAMLYLLLSPVVRLPATTSEPK